MVGNNHASRRRVLQSVGAGSGVIAASTGIGQARKSDKIVTVIGTDGTALEEKQVPRKWLNHEQKAKSERYKLNKTLSSNPQVHNVYLGTRDKTIRGKKISELVVNSRNPGNLKEKLNDSQNGIRISHEEYTGQPELDSCTDRCGRDEYDPVPGGCLLQGGSAACRVQNENGEERMLTAAHNVVLDGDKSWKDCNEYVSPVEQGKNDQDMGEVDEVNPEGDWATIHHDTSTDLDYGYSSDIFDPDGADYPVEGHVTESGVYDLKSTTKNIYKSGFKSCKTSGPIVDMYRDSGLVCTSISGHNFVKADLCTEGGDSGSAYYDTRYSSYIGDYHAVIAVHSRGESLGYGAYDIHQDNGYTFG